MAASKKPPAKKTTTRKTAAKKATKPAAKKKAAPKAASAARQTSAERPEAGAQTEAPNLQSILARIRAGFGEAAEALSEAGDKLGDTRREVLLTILEDAQENADQTFETLRDVIESDNLGDSLRIQREALRESIERSVAQVREISSIATEGGKASVEPVSEYVSKLRTRRHDKDGDD
ncbi:MAG: phasin family protein [Pseudomonadota bacterium]